MYASPPGPNMNRDSSGTEDDMPNHGIIRASRMVISETKRILSGPISREKEILDMDFQIHSLEREAYGAVMRAFFAQSDSLTWGKETLMSDLRKELRLSDDEHREILGTIHSDESMKAIREWRASTEAMQMSAPNPTGFDSTFMGHMPIKKLKTGSSSVLPIARYPSSAQPSPTHALTVSVRKDHRGSNAAQFSPPMNPGLAIVPVHPNRPAASMSTGKARAPPTAETTKPDIIKLCQTDKVLYEVQKACGAENPDPVQVERAKMLLREHERALVEAIGKLADMAEGDDSPDHRRHQYSGGEPQRNAYGVRIASHKKLERTRCYYNGYAKDQPGALIPVVDLPDEEYDGGR